MLKGIPNLIPPQLLADLSSMGHGDEIVIADANFPGESLNNRTLRCDGSEVSELLGAILQLFPLDKASEYTWTMMQPSDFNQYDETLEIQYHQLLLDVDAEIGEPEKIKRHEFYQRASEAFVVVMTGTTKRFGNIILKKGIIL